MTPLKALPVDLDDFTQVRAAGRYLYVDKTPQIARMIRDDPRHVFLARPRRFGKTLLISTLEALFRGERGKFQGTWIYRNWDWDRQRYPVLRLDMALRDIHDAAALRSELKFRMMEFDRADDPAGLDREMSPSQMLRTILRHRAERAGREAVVLVDEYDTPITENLERQDAVGEILDVLRAFYGTLKDNARLIRFTFMTGITRFARVGLFSGANHLHDLSFPPQASDLVGFTQPELEDRNPSGLRALIENGARHLGWTVENLYQALEDHYNGYLFAKGGQTVYNPFSLIHCLYDISTAERTRSLPETRLPNYWADSGSPRLLLRLLESSAYPLSVPTHDHPDVVEATKYDVQAPHFAALLCQTGYLTRKEAWNPETRNTEWRLDFPNAAVAHTFQESLVDWQSRRIHRAGGLRTAHFDLAHAIYNALRKPDVSGLHATFNALLRATHHFLHPPALPLRKVPAQSAWKNILDYEIHCQALLNGTFALMGIQVYGELPTVAGRIDIAVEVEGRIFIIELKGNGNAEQAVRQALIGDCPAHFAPGNRPVAVWGLNIDTRARAVTECALWDLGRYNMAQGRWDREPFALPLLYTATAPDTAKANPIFRPGLQVSRPDRAS